MVKVKNKKNTAKPQFKKKNDAKKKLNPFEVHINREKLKVLNRKQKHVRGTPGVSRSKAISKRKNTLLQEYKVHKKSNRFTDMRIGEKDPTMPEENRMIARYTAEKVKSHKKKSIFNLADDEVLTHKGQLLTEIEKFENDASDMDDDEDDDNLQSDFVKEAHFGGGLFHKVSSDGAKSHKDLINQLIIESKKRKNERLKIKEQTLELTEKLDTEWKDLLPLVNATNRKKSAQEETQEPAAVKAKNDDYDKVMRELKFESRGNPSDRLKSEEEILRKEKEELQRFEMERERRMCWGDDLEDNFMFEEINDEEEEKDEEVLNEDGLVNEDKQSKKKSKKKKKKNEEEEELEESGDKLSEDVEESEKRNNKKKSKKTKEESEDDSFVLQLSDEETSEDFEDHHVKHDNKKNKEDSEDETLEIEEPNEGDDEAEESDDNQSGKSNEEDEENSDDDDVISLTDLKADASESSSEDEEVEKETSVAEKTPTISKEKESDKLPMEVTFPDCYSILEGTFEYVKPEKNGLVLQKLAQLTDGNKEKAHLLFTYILQYLDSSLCTFKKLAYLLPEIFQLAKANPEKSYAALRDYLKEKQAAYRAKPKKYPPFSVLLVLKTIGVLYPTSDFRHGIVTPTFAFISQLLNQCRVKTKRDVCYGLFLVTLVLEYTVLSKRYLPAAINFLTGLIHSAIPVTAIKVSSPFRKAGSLLILENNLEEYGGDLRLQESDLRNVDSTNPVFQSSALSLAVKLLVESVVNATESSSKCEMFERTLQCLKVLPLHNYPVGLQTDVESLIERLETERDERTLEFITAPKKKPKLLKLYEPNIETVYDGKKHKGKSREKLERDKLLHKIKRETKGAMREIRRDKAFLGRVQINQRLEGDAERREKVKRIYSEAASQQAELNSLDRKKKKR